MLLASNLPKSGEQRAADSESLALHGSALHRVANIYADRKYLRTDLEVKQGDEPFVDFVSIAEKLSPIVCANRHSSLVLPFVDRCLPTNGANQEAIVSPACFTGILVAILLCTAAFGRDY